MIQSSVKVYREIPIREKEILRYLRCKENGIPREALTECIRLAEPHLAYRVCYRECQVTYERDGAYLPFYPHPSKTLKAALQGAERAIVFAASIGHGIDRLIQGFGIRSTLQGLILDSYANERIESLCDTFCREITGSVLRVSAGYGDIPIEMQRDIFSYLSPECIGVTLNESLMLSPQKSVTAILPLRKETI